MKNLALLFCALMYLLPGVALVLVPEWSYKTFAEFQPFNRHFLGDAGVFSFAIGVGLLMAVRNPIQHRATLAVGAVSALLHLLNHLYDDVIVDGGNFGHLLNTSLPLAITAGLLIWLYYDRGDSKRGLHRPKHAEPS